MKGSDVRMVRANIAVLARRVIVILFGCYLLSVPVAAADKIPFVVAPDVLDQYRLFMRGRDELDIRKLDPDLPRDVRELFATLYILKLGGLEFDADFITSPSLERHVTLLRVGGAAMSGAFVDWNDVVAVPDVIALEGLGSAGHQLVGLYTAPKNARARAVRSLAGLSELSAVSNKAWHQDWKILENAGLRELVSVADWEAMIRMVLAARVDFLLAPVPSGQGDILATRYGPLVRMTRFAARFSARRHFVISQKHAAAHALQQALALGFSRLGGDHFLMAAFAARETDTADEDGLIILKAY